VPAAAVIPAPIAHTNIAAVKTLVVERRHRSGFWDVSSRVFGEHAVVGPRERLRVLFEDHNPGRLRPGARGTQRRAPSGCVSNLGGGGDSFGGRSQTYLLVRRVASSSATRWVAVLPDRDIVTGRRGR